MSNQRTYAVIGATGVVGKEAITILRDRGVPAANIRALASERSAGTCLHLAGDQYPVAAAHSSALRDVDVVLHCADAETSKRLSPIAASFGSLIVDNSSAYRMDDNVPLVVPEINANSIKGDHRIIANPNCSTVLLLMALNSLRHEFGIRRIHVTTYQAVSGAGQAGIDELQSQVKSAATGAPAHPHHFREPCLGNVFSHDSPVDVSSGLNGEERKIIEESRKIWNDPALEITPTCVRVPVVRAHTLAIVAEFFDDAQEDRVRGILQTTPGVQVIDDRADNRFPTPLKASGKDDILVGRIRPDPSEQPSRQGAYKRWCLLACGDQIRKGAALNAVQIAEYSLRSGRQKIVLSTST